MSVPHVATEADAPAFANNNPAAVANPNIRAPLLFTSYVSLITQIFH
jgi:hypothetical protein